MIIRLGRRSGSRFRVESLVAKVIKRNLSKDSRIGVIGGGPGGLSFSYYLQKKGYNNIKILEKEKRLGGKALTLNLKDPTRNNEARSYELGAEFITYAYDNLWSIVNELKIKTAESSLIRVIDKKKPGHYIDPVHLAPWYQMGWASAKYLYYGFKYSKEINSLTNVGIHKNKFLSQNVTSLVKTLKLESLAGMFIVEQFGYGTFDTFPVVHLYRTVSPRMMLRILGDKIPIIRNLFKRPIAAIAVDGCQNLFQQLGHHIDEKSNSQAIYLDENVSEIGRNKANNSIVVKTDKSEFEFDYLVCAIPPDNLLSLWNVDIKGENMGAIKLFEKFQYHPYYVDCFENLSSTKLGKYYFQNLNAKKGEPVQLNKRYEDGSIVARGYNFKNYDTAVKDKQEINKEFDEFIKKRMLIDQVKYIDSSATPWPTYHPHVSLKEFQSGFFDKLEELQGKNNFFYVGDAMTMENMELTLKYSKHAVETYF